MQWQLIATCPNKCSSQTCVSFSLQRHTTIASIFSLVSLLNSVFEWSGTFKNQTKWLPLTLEIQTSKCSNFDWVLISSVSNLGEHYGYKQRILYYQFMLIGPCRVQPETLSSRHSASPARSLIGRSFRDGRNNERLHSRSRVVRILFLETRVDDVDDVVDGQ